MEPVRLRLFHTPGGVRIASREHGTGRPLILLHSAGLSHREFEPLAAELGDRYRLILCDLPGHGDSETRRAHPYSLNWLADVVGAFCHDVGGSSPIVGGHGLGGDLLLLAIERGVLTPGHLVLMPCDLHRPPGPVTREMRRRGRWVGRVGPARALRRPLARLDASRLSERNAIGAAELLRHATLDLATDDDRAGAWSRVAANLPSGPRGEVLDQLPRITCPTLLLWADSDPDHELRAAEEALDLLPNGLLRVLDGTGYLIAYDDPVGVARELAAFIR